MSEATPAPEPANTRAWSPMLALALISIVLVGVPWAFKLLTPPALGEPCGGGFDCAALDGRCVAGEHGSFCTRVCQADDDCPASGHCGVPPHDEWQRWFSASVMSERFCVPGPRPAAPAEAATEQMPGDEAGAQFRPPEQRGGLGGSKLKRGD